MVELKIKQIDPETRKAILEAPDGFVVATPDPLPERFTVGDIFEVDDDLDLPARLHASGVAKRMRKSARKGH